MKKLSIIISLLILVSLLLGACAPKATPEPEGPVSFEGKTLRFLTIQPHNVAAINLAAWFEQETGAKVELIVVPYDNVVEKAVLDVSSGANQIDVIEYWYPGLGTMVENNVLENLDQWYVDNAAMIKADDFYPEYFDVFTKIGNSRYGIPYDGDMHVLWYYKPLLEKYGFEPPKTWDEYLNICKTITEGEGGQLTVARSWAPVALILIGSYLNRFEVTAARSLTRRANLSLTARKMSRHWKTWSNRPSMPCQRHRRPHSTKHLAGGLPQRLPWLNSGRTLAR